MGYSPWRGARLGTSEGALGWGGDHAQPRHARCLTPLWAQHMVLPAKNARTGRKAARGGCIYGEGRNSKVVSKVLVTDLCTPSIALPHSLTSQELKLLFRGRQENVVVELYNVAVDVVVAVHELLTK